MARTIGVSRTSLYEIIAGRRSPGAAALAALARFLGLPADTVLEWHQASGVSE